MKTIESVGPAILLTAAMLVGAGCGGSDGQPATTATTGTAQGAATTAATLACPGQPNCGNGQLDLKPGGMMMEPCDQGNQPMGIQPNWGTDTCETLLGAGYSGSLQCNCCNVDTTMCVAPAPAAPVRAPAAPGAAAASTAVGGQGG